MTLHQLDHSVGFVVVATNAQGEDWSWRVHDDGEVQELGGWGASGPVPDIAENPPANPATTVHTVAVTANNKAVRLGLRRLVEEHNDLYGEIHVYWTPGAERELANWIRAGCPEDAHAPTDEELAERNRAEVPHANDGNFTTSEPRPVPEHDAGSIPSAGEVEKQLVAEARQKAAEAERAKKAEDAKARAREKAKEKRAAAKASQGAGDAGQGEPAKQS